MVAGIGASAGGLEACLDLLDAMPLNNGIAFVLIQHLDPTHKSMLVDLLATHTAMPVLEACDGMQIETDHVYVIAPGTDLSVKDGMLLQATIRTSHGVRLPFDLFLQSLATEYGARAACVILSGNGADGSIGLQAIHEHAGLVIAQDPAEARYRSMPDSAIATGSVDRVLPVRDIAQALCAHSAQLTHPAHPGSAANAAPRLAADLLQQFIELLRTHTSYDFTLYKQGTLRRRIERRLAMASMKYSDMGAYLEALRHNPQELEVLAKDLLINVTKFFRDPEVFELLAHSTIPDLIQNHPHDQPLRVWIAGCSTGEETYSIAMLLREALAKAQRGLKLQFFASDVDPDAIEQAREGLYPNSIEADVAPARLERYFSKEEHGYRISADLRAIVVFTVQDVLADPPFSRIDLISCRNLLIYLRPEAQTRVISIFHFALRERGILLLGSSENAGGIDGRFETVAKSQRIYRRIGLGRAGSFGFATAGANAVRPSPRAGSNPSVARQSAVAELCQRLVMQAYAPAAVLINRKHDCLYFLGPTERYLRAPAGAPTHDLLAMAPDLIRGSLRAAIAQACHVNAPSSVSGSRLTENNELASFSICVRPVLSEGEELLLVCFVDEPQRRRAPAATAMVQDLPRITELEQELDAAHTELRGAIRNIEVMGEEQKAVNEEALSVNEEYQSTNEELLTSKEELQSLNEELTALNSQLQETLERQRTTSDDLQNVLYSTDVATLFLDTKLNIRFFTPATKLLFSVIPGDIGRPLSDLTSLAADAALLGDARAVLQSLAPIEREIETHRGACFIRRVLPYRTHDDGVEGVVITFTDITQLKQVGRALEAAKQQAVLANAAKSRFLAAASHDLRQPLQTLKLLQASLLRTAHAGPPRNLITRMGETLSSMAEMLNTLLDINQIEAGVVQAQAVEFPINKLLDRLRHEFAYHAQARGLGFRVVPCGLSIRSDPHLLEQMLRNLISNALKYTVKGRVLIGCRRHHDTLRIEIWDTGIGIAKEELHAIFEEYHQLDNAARERSHGLGLGLAIVQRLANLLDHRIRVRSYPNRGSVFWVEVALGPKSAAIPLTGAAPALLSLAQPTQASPASLPLAAGAETDAAAAAVAAAAATQAGLSMLGASTALHPSILVVEDDPETRQLLEALLQDHGYRTRSAADGVAALALISGAAPPLDLVITDYNLPNGLNGLEFSLKMREKIERTVPVIILSGDISTETIQAITGHNCVYLNKPIDFATLMRAIKQQLAPSPMVLSLPSPAAPAAPADDSTVSPEAPDAPTVYMVDDDPRILEALCEVVQQDGRRVRTFSTCEAFLASYRPGGGAACLLIDAYLPGMKGLELLQQLRSAGHPLPAIMITGHSDVHMAVQAMKAGASDFIEKPVSGADLLESIERALAQSLDSNKLSAWQAHAAHQLIDLTTRQRQVMALVLAGKPSKIIAADLGISQRTVENHRASIMKKTGSKSLPALARLALAAVAIDRDHPAA
jgi:two-component system CheB/CheR fusion protein